MKIALDPDTAIWPIYTQWPWKLGHIPQNVICPSEITNPYSHKVSSKSEKKFGLHCVHKNSFGLTFWRLVTLKIGSYGSKSKHFLRPSQGISTPSFIEFGPVLLAQSCTQGLGNSRWPLWTAVTLEIRSHTPKSNQFISSGVLAQLSTQDSWQTTRWTDGQHKIYMSPDTTSSAMNYPHLAVFSMILSANAELGQSQWIICQRGIQYAFSYLDFWKVGFRSLTTTLLSNLRYF